MAGPRIGPTTSTGSGHTILGGKIVGYRLSGQGVIRGARDTLGRFVSMQTEINLAHRRMAEALQRAVLGQFQDSLERRAQRKTRYLEKALASTDAIRFNLDGFLYLPDGYLDSTPARFYWRHIERGTRVFVGRELRGFFRSLEGNISGPSSRRRGRDPYMPQLGATFGAFKGNQQSTIRIGSPTYGALKATVGKRRLEQRTSFDQDLNEGTDAHPFVREVPLLNRRQVVNGSRGQGYPIVIKNPIRPHLYLQLGIERFLASGQIAELYDEALGSFAAYRKTTSSKGNVVARRR